MTSASENAAIGVHVGMADSPAGRSQHSFSRWVLSLYASVRAYLSHSVHRRFIGIITVVFGIVAVAFGTITYAVTRASIYDQLDAELLQVAADFASALAQGEDSLPQTGSDSPSVDSGSIELVEPNKSVTSISGEDGLTIGAAEITIARTQFGHSAREGVNANGDHFRIVAIPVTVDDTAYAVVVGREMTAPAAALWNLLWATIIVGVVTIVIGVMVGVWGGKTAMRPIRRFTNSVLDVTNTDQLRTVTVSGVDEIGDLGRALNLMIETLAQSRERQRRLIADASHELRTPLTSRPACCRKKPAVRSCVMWPPSWASSPP